MNRRWLQFSLRSFLVLLTAICLWLGWNTERARKQGEAIAAVTKLGGRVSHVWKTRAEDGYPGNWQRPVPTWLCELLGDDFLFDVGLVSFGSKAVDADALWIAHFDAHSIRFLSLNSLQLSDVALDSLPYMPSLKTLKLSGEGITDEGLANLSKCPNAISLSLYYAPRVTDAGSQFIKRLTN